jgi:lipoprotein-releasing system permease protein
MFQPLPLFLGLRYVRSRSRGFFVSFISWISMLGICVGVTALITIISVMNGFERELRTRLLSLSSHATIAAPPDRMQQWPDLAKRIRAEQGVVGVAPYLDLQGMVGRGQELRPALIRGVLPQEEAQVSEIGTHMAAGALEDLRPGERGIVLGTGLSWALEARVGDEITVLVPTKSAAGAGMVAGIDLIPRIQSFTVAGVFEVGLQEHDNVLALVNLEDA